MASKCFSVTRRRGTVQENATYQVNQKKIPLTTFVDITAMHGNFCTKFYTIVKRSNIHFITKFY